MTSNPSIGDDRHMTYRLPRTLGLSIAVLGLLVALTPKWLLPICEYQSLGIVPGDYHPTMRCFWFGQAEILLGMCVIVAGLILIIRPARDTQFSVGALLLPLSAAIYMVSLNSVIGSVCGHQNSSCQVGTKPAERLAAGILLILGIAALLSSFRDPQRR